jgi:hypothetical protein
MTLYDVWAGWRLRTKFLHFGEAISFGLPAAEYVNAMISAGLDLNLPRVLQTQSWDVTQLLAVTPPSTSPVVASDWYAFLWDDSKLWRAVRQPPTWRQVQPSLPKILRHYGQRPSKWAIQSLQRICVTLDTRPREMVGAIELLHSSCYTNEAVITGIARFLETERR